VLLVVAALALLGGMLVSAPSRQPAPAFDLPGWRLVLVEDFDTPVALGDFADRYPGWAGYDGLRDTSRRLGRASTASGLYSSATTATVDAGLLDIHVHTAGGVPQVMALTPTPDDRFWEGQRYGRYAVRFRTDVVPGYKIAWLLWPSDDTWTNGEIDFPEGALGGEITGNAHDVTGDPRVNAWSITTGRTMGTWHTATIEWVPGRLTFILDGRSWTTSEPRALPAVPMRWVLQTETDLSTTAPDPDAQGHVWIDWVAAWSYAGG
jgi:hypothetical protein